MLSEKERVFLLNVSDLDPDSAGPSQPAAASVRAVSAGHGQ